MIVTDDQRFDTMNVMPKTVEWFGHGGARFTKAFATTPMCCPSRASIFTGRYAHNHGVTTNAGARNLDQDSTVQRLLRDAGYRTAFVGKYLNSWGGGIPPPHFDRWTVLPPAGPLGTYYRDTYNVDGNLQDVAAYSTDYLTSRAVEYLHSFEAQDDVPWLLYVSPQAPHLPAEPAPRHAGAKVPEWSPGPNVPEQNRSDKPPWVSSVETIPVLGELTRMWQLRTLMSVDDLVARVMGRMGKLGERNNTLAFFVSDNGVFWR
ncbi:MAG: sulfatase-like hydrolase/transferase, partial [Actinomycetota bacterium]|nr:sulfatase-like hydrolase/transferase [Actinomycetota bacterium]